MCPTKIDCIRLVPVPSGAGSVMDDVPLTVVFMLESICEVICQVFEEQFVFATPGA